MHMHISRQFFTYNFKGIITHTYIMYIPRLPTAVCSSDSVNLESICEYCFKAPTSSKLTGTLKRIKSLSVSFLLMILLIFHIRLYR